MSKSKNKLNGSVELLAKALKGVVSEAIEENNDLVLTTIRDDMAAMEGRLNDRIDTTNENMSKQFSTQAKYISEQIDKRLGKD